MLLINMKLTSWHFLFTAPNQFYFERMSLLLEIGALKNIFLKIVCISEVRLLSQHVGLPSVGFVAYSVDVTEYYKCQA